MSGIFLLLLSALVRLPWIFTIPVNAAPDEYAHLQVITFLCQHLRLPTATEVASGGPAFVYGSLPQFGYLPQVLLASLLPHSSLVLSARLGSLLAGLVTVWAGYCCARELFPGSRLLQLSLPLMLIFHPQLVFVQSYANNDATACALGSLLVLLLIVMLKNGMTLKQCFLAGALVCWLSLSKYSGWSLLPVVALTLPFAASLSRSGLKRAFTYLAIIMLALCLTTGIWLCRNFHEFNGDWLGTGTMYHTWAVTFHKQLAYHIWPWQVVGDKRWWRFLLFSFWALFGYTNCGIWRPLYFIFLAFQALACWGWTCVLITRRWSHSNPVAVTIWSMLLLCCLFNLLGMVFASMENLGGPQGRYLFVSEIPVMAILLSGLHRLGPKFGRWAVGALVSFTACVCLGSWLMLFHLYGLQFKL